MAYKIMGITSSPFYTNMMIYYIMCDTPADLPSTISDIGYGTTVGYGSRADIISDSSKYLWNGSQWVRQTTGGGGGASSADQVSYDNTDSGLTATNVQDAIDELHDTDETQDNALVELSGENTNQQLEINYAINTGSKNLLPNKYSIGTVTEMNGFRFTAMEDGGIKIESIGTHNANGDYYILGNWGNTQTILDLSGDTYTVTFSSGTTISGISLRIFGASNAPIINNLYINNSRDVTNVQVKFVFITVTSTTTLPEGGIIVYPMIRNSVIRNATFEPYAPTNRELYETKLSAEDVWGYGQSIPNSADLNDYTTGGKYYGGNSAGNSVLNLPVANGSFSFTLEVKQVNPSMTYQYLRVCRLADDPYIYCRRRYNSWGSWYRFTGEIVVASVQSVSPSLMLNREEITPLETDEIKETEETALLETNEIEETE